MLDAVARVRRTTGRRGKLTKVGWRMEGGSVKRMWGSDGRSVPKPQQVSEMRSLWQRRTSVREFGKKDVYLRKKHWLKEDLNRKRGEI